MGRLWARLHQALLIHLNISYAAPPAGRAPRALSSRKGAYRSTRADAPASERNARRLVGFYTEFRDLAFGPFLTDAEIAIDWPAGFDIPAGLPTFVWNIACWSNELFGALRRECKLSRFAEVQ